MLRLVTSLGWRPARHVGPRHSATPLGLAGGGEPWRPALHRLLARGRGTAVRRGLAGVPLPPPPFAGLPAGCPPVPPPLPCGGGSASGASGDAVVGVLASAGPRPAAAAGGGGGGLLPCPPGVEGEKRKGERRCHSSARAQGAGGLAGGEGIL